MSHADACNPMTETPRARAEAATAGFQLLGAIIACAAAGFGLGSLVGIAVPLGLAGLFVGLIVGFALVYARFRRI
jgi:pilus assembly protein TadC